MTLQWGKICNEMVKTFSVKHEPMSSEVFASDPPYFSQTDQCHVWCMLQW